jgi:hypothetical protein
LSHPRIFIVDNSIWNFPYFHTMGAVPHERICSRILGGRSL